jgi:class 3 adenylate cyclase
MGLTDDLKSEVRTVFATNWQKREGEVVPEAESVRLGNDAVTFAEAVVLYADLAESTNLVQEYPDYFAAEVYKTFLHCSSKIIRKNNGEITAFDGDRVMAVFIGDSKRTNAAKSALQIDYAVNQIINPALKNQYPSRDYAVHHAVGIDVSSLFIARTGIRGSNDLVWVGRAANYAAKLCSIRSGIYTSFITADVYNALHESAKIGGNPQRNMWEEYWWDEYGITIYRSSWYWVP